MKYVLLKQYSVPGPWQGWAILVACLAGVMSALCTAPCHAQSPVITSVSKISTQQYQTIVISGSGFGKLQPYIGDSSYIALDDETNWFSAGFASGTAYDDVTLVVESWKDSKIVLGGFSGEWGYYNWTLRRGDLERVYVWNAQSGNGPASVDTTIVGEAT